MPSSPRKTKKVKSKDDPDPQANPSEHASSPPETSEATDESTSEQENPSSPDHSKPCGHEECVVVGIGASAGGLEAFKKFLQAMPHDSGMAFVLIQHLDPDHESLMADLLSKYTSMQVVQAEDAMTILPNQVYMIPPNRFIKLYDGGLFLDKPVKQRGLRLPIDYFFRSLAEHRRERAVAIVLSGTGSDGTLGIKEIKAQGGMIMVQQPETSTYDGMPRSAIATSVVDFVLPIEKMPGVLAKYVQHSYVEGKDQKTLLETASDHYKSIINLLRAHTEYDFRCYKKGTLSRRIQRRMGLRQVEKIADYLGLLRKDREEIHSLFKDLLISVTAFFREKEAWVALEQEVIAKIVSQKKFDQPVRVWVPGCATGEEAYSIAMLLYEQFELQNKNLGVQIFATDLDTDAIETARQGVYPMSIAADVSPMRLQKFFHEEGEHYRVNKRLRESCVFAAQNLISDPPFSKLDLISCRNVMIYLEQEVQQKMIQMFHFALRNDGCLFVGASESIGKHTKLYTQVSKKWRIYRKSGVTQRTGGNFPIIASIQNDDVESMVADSGVTQAFSAVEMAKKTLLDKFAPATVLINRAYEIQYFHGPVRRYLDIPSGEPTTELTAMCLDGLRSKLRGLVHMCLNDEAQHSVVAPSVERDGQKVAVRITAELIPVRKGTIPMILVSFVDEERKQSRKESPKPEEASPPDSSQPQEKPQTNDEKGSPDPPAQVVEQLEYELQATREDLQSTIEELETSNEELKASNEEVLSMNEELQSTNEELETSREELQSLNEELSTVNNQLEEKVHELEDTNNDLSNLLVSTEIATIFLDTNFRIRRFTPSTTELLNVIATDTGRPISDLSPRFNDPLLYQDARNVLKKLTSIEREVRVETNGVGFHRDAYPAQDQADDDTRWFIRRILPYRTGDNKIDGVVITFTDVSSLKDSLGKLERRERQTAVLAQLGRLALTTQDLQSLFTQVTRIVADTLGNRFCKVLKLLPGQNKLQLVAGVGWHAGLVGQAIINADIDSQAGYTLHHPGPIIVKNLDKEKRFSAPALLLDHGIVSGISVVIGPPNHPWGVFSTHSHVQTAFTVDDANFIQAVAHILWEYIDQQRNKQQYRALVDASAQIVWTTNPEGKVVEDSPSWRRFTGQTYQQWKGFGWLNALHEEDRNRVKESWLDAVANKEKYFTTYRLRHTDKAWRWMAVRAVPLIEPDGLTRGWIGMNIDISEQEITKRRLERLTEILEQRVKERTGLISLLHDVTAACHQASTVEEAVAYVLRTFTHYNRWCFGHAFRPAENDPDVVVAFMDYYPEDGTERFQQVREVTYQSRFRRGEGMMGRVFENNKAEVAYDLSSFVPARRSVLKAVGIETVVMLPIVSGKRVHAVLEFYSDERIEIDVRLMEGLENVAMQLGLVIERKELQRRIVNQSMDEQARLGRELHDGVGQQVAGMSMLASTLHQQLSEKGLEQEATTAEKLETTTEKAKTQIRSLVRGLQFVEVESDGLSVAVTELAHDTEAVYRVKCSVNDGDHLAVEDNFTATQLYRIVREATLNAARHACAKQIDISMHRDDGRLVLIVKDDGHGFQQNEPNHLGYGLDIMRYRANIIGAELDVQSLKDRGTMVKCTYSRQGEGSISS